MFGEICPCLDFADASRSLRGIRLLDEEAAPRAFVTPRAVMWNHYLQPERLDDENRDLPEMMTRFQHLRPVASVHMHHDEHTTDFEAAYDLISPQ